LRKSSFIASLHQSRPIFDSDFSQLVNKEMVKSIQGGKRSCPTRPVFPLSPTLRRLWHAQFLSPPTIDLTSPTSHLSDPEEWTLVCTEKTTACVCVLCEREVLQDQLNAHVGRHLLEVLEMMKRV